MQTTIFTAYNNTKKFLKSAGISNFAFEARQILRHITGLSNAEILTKYSETLTPLQQTVLNNIVTRRATGYPLQYILGYWSFFGLDFWVGEGVLIPRPETELLVETALVFLKDKQTANVLDLCSGSGCIAISVAKNCQSNVLAVEKYQQAYEFLLKNIKKHSAAVTPVLADVFEFTPHEKFDLIVSNPPYVSAKEMEIIDTATSFEPDTALYGGEDGMLFYRKIARDYKDYLTPGGMLAFEVGFSQGEAVADLLKTLGYNNVGIKNDLEGIGRVVFGTVN